MHRFRIGLRSAVVVFGAPLALGCAAKRPTWATRPDNATLGDSTIDAEPLSVPKRTSAITLDGKLDEPAWQGASVAGPFVSPGDGHLVEKHPVSGFARLTWDDEKLYVGVIVDDRSPFAPFGRDESDPHIWERSSAIELMIQPGDPGDNRDYYEVQVDVGGAVFDTRWDDYNRPITTPPGGGEATKVFGHMDWQSRVERAVHVDARGGFYSVELAIPFQSFAQVAEGRAGEVTIPPKPGEVWRMNIYTFRDGQRQALAWSSIRGQGNFHKASRFGRVRF